LYCRAAAYLSCDILCDSPGIIEDGRPLRSCYEAVSHLPLFLLEICHEIVSPHILVVMKCGAFTPCPLIVELQDIKLLSLRLARLDSSAVYR
jgi:hypothetical protein